MLVDAQVSVITEAVEMEEPLDTSVARVLAATWKMEPFYSRETSVCCKWPINASVCALLTIERKIGV